MEKKTWGLIRNRYNAISMSYDTSHTAQCNVFLLHAATLWYDVNNTALYNKYKSLCHDFLCFGFIHVVSVWKQLDTMVKRRHLLNPNSKNDHSFRELDALWILMYECQFSYLVRACRQQGSLYKVANHHHHHHRSHESLCIN